MKVSKLKLVAVVLLATLVSCLLTSSPASAGTYTSVYAQASDPTPGTNAAFWGINESSVTAATVKCLQIYIDSNASFSSTSPAATPLYTPTGNSLFTAGTWTTSNPVAITNTSGWYWTSSAGMTSPGGSYKNFGFNINNPATAGNYFLKVLTYTDTGCTALVDSGVGDLVLSNPTTVGVSVDPSFTFAVGGQAAATACNGVTTTVATSSNTVPFGHVPTSGRSFGLQMLNIATNAGNGYVIYLHSTATTANVMKGQGTHVVNDSGSVPVPAAGTSFFGYTTDSSTAAVTSGTIKSVPLSTGNDVVGNGPAATATGLNCVAYGFGASATTPADSYGATVVYTAVPTF